jgi:hypothetical protein
MGGNGDGDALGDLMHKEASYPWRDIYRVLEKLLVG